MRYLRTSPNVIHYQKLPSEYQEVEWIKSNGNCVLDTGYSPTGNYLGVELKMKFNTISAAQGNVPFVYGYVASNMCYLTNNPTTGLGCANGGTHLSSYNEAVAGTEYTINIVANNGTQSMNINGTSYSGSCGASVSTGNIPLFCRKNTNYEYFATDMTLYYFKMYSLANTLERSLVPCYRKADNVIGMYDIVNNQFYTNSGTGSFTKGNDVN